MDVTVTLKSIIDAAVEGKQLVGAGANEDLYDRLSFIDEQASDLLEKWLNLLGISVSSSLHKEPSQDGKEGLEIGKA